MGVVKVKEAGYEHVRENIPHDANPSIGEGSYSIPSTPTGPLVTARLAQST
jgi:hypothetical protein